MAYTEKVDTTNPTTQIDELGQNITPNDDVQEVKNFNPKNTNVPTEDEATDNTVVPFTDDSTIEPVQPPQETPDPNEIDHEKLKSVLRQLWSTLPVNHPQRNGIANIYNDSNNAYVKFYNNVIKDSSILDSVYKDLTNNNPSSSVFFDRYGEGVNGFKSFIYGNNELDKSKETETKTSGFGNNPSTQTSVEFDPVKSYTYNPQEIVSKYRDGIIGEERANDLERTKEMLRRQNNPPKIAFDKFGNIRGEAKLPPSANVIKTNNNQIAKINQQLDDNRQRKEMAYFMDKYLVGREIDNFVEDNNINVKSLGEGIMKDMYPEKYKALIEKEKFLKGEVTAEQAEESILDSFYKRVFTDAGKAFLPLYNIGIIPTNEMIDGYNKALSKFDINEVKSLDKEGRYKYFKKFLSYGLTESEESDLNKWSNEGINGLLKSKYGFTDDELDLIFTPAYDSEAFRKALEKETIASTFIDKGVITSLLGIKTYLDEIKKEAKPYQDYINGAIEMTASLRPEWDKLQKDISKYLDKDGNVLDITKGVAKHAKDFNNLIAKQEKFLSDNPIWNAETFDDIESYVNSDFVKQTEQYVSLYSHLFDKYQTLTKDRKSVFPLISAFTERNELIGRLQNEQLRSIKENNDYINKILRTEKLTNSEKESLEAEKITMFGTETILGIKSSLRHWGKNLVNLPKLRELIVDGGVYSYFDYASDMYSASLDRYGYKDIPYNNPLFEDVVSIDVDDETYSVVTDDKGVVLPSQTIRDKDDLVVYDGELKKIILDKYNQGNKDGTNTVEKNVNKGFAFKTSKVLMDLAFQVLITKGVGTTFSAATQPLLRQYSILRQPIASGMTGSKYTGIIPAARNTTADAVGMHLGIFSAITAQTNEEFRKKGREAGLYGDALEQYVMTQSAMISLINLINPNVRMSAGKRNLLERAFFTKTPTENFKRRLVTGKVPGTGTDVVNKTPYRMFGQLFAGTNGAARLQIKDSGKTILIRGGLESVEEMTELPGEVLVNNLWSQFSPMSTETVEELKENQNWLNFKMSEIPDFNMFAESGILGFVGGGGHGIISVGNNIIHAHRAPDAFDSSILADYMNNPEGMKKMLYTLEGEYIYAPPGSEITYDLNGVNGLTLASKKKLDDIARALDGLVEQSEKFLPPNPSDAEKGMIMNLISKKSHYQTLLDLQQRKEDALKLIASDADIQSTDDKESVSMKVLRKALSTIDNQLEQVNTWTKKSYSD